MVTADSVMAIIQRLRHAVIGVHLHRVARLNQRRRHTNLSRLLRQPHILRRASNLTSEELRPPFGNIRGRLRNLRDRIRSRRSRINLNRRVHSVRDRIRVSLRFLHRVRRPNQVSFRVHEVSRLLVRFTSRLVPLLPSLDYRR